MLRKMLPLVVATAVMAAGGIASASWLKSGSGDAYGKGKTLATPTSLSLTCGFGSPTTGKNNWKLTWNTTASGSNETQTVTQTDGSTQSLASTATQATWTTSAGTGTFTASVQTKNNNWLGTQVTSSGFRITAASGHCS